MRPTPDIYQKNEPTLYLSGAKTYYLLDFTKGRSVLMSYAYRKDFPKMFSYLPTWNKAMLDSGAFSVMNTGQSIDIDEYYDFVREKHVLFEGCAALDVITDWRESQKNWQKLPDLTFPTFHQGEPIELFLEYCQEQNKRNGWVGLGAQRPNGRLVMKDVIKWVSGLKQYLHQFPNVHFHGFGITACTPFFPFGSTDNAAWVRSIQTLYSIPALRHLTKSEFISIEIARLERAPYRDISEGKKWFQDYQMSTGDALNIFGGEQ